MACAIFVSVNEEASDLMPNERPELRKHNCFSTVRIKVLVSNHPFATLMKKNTWPRSTGFHERDSFSLFFVFLTPSTFLFHSDVNLITARFLVEIRKSLLTRPINSHKEHPERGISTLEIRFRALA